MNAAHPAVVNTSRPGYFKTTVVDNRPLSRRYYLLVLARPKGMQEPGSGSFVHLMIPHAGRFFLRRPFSVLDCDKTTISLVIVEKGEGTQLIRGLPAGTEMDLVGPLGSTFPRVPGRRILGLGGGVGLAPLYYYGVRKQPGDCESFRLLYGARSREDLFLDEFAWRYDDVAFSTDDGSEGFAGTVVEFAEQEIARAPVDVMFCCGPNRMLRAAEKLARRSDLPLYVSLENRMACALGACRSCVVLTRSGDSVSYRTVCREGPVFDADVLVWEELPEA